MELVTVKELYKNREAYLDNQVTVGGWVRSIRDSKTFGFIVVNDGSFFETLQVVYHDSMDNFAEISKLNVGAAIIGAIAITGMGDDDDESIMYNLMLYHADRLASEAASFTPFGAYAEGKKLWSSPVAIGQTINDLIGTTAMAARFLIEEDFTEEYTTGRYKGMNKFEIMAVRNIPVVRSINRVLDLPNNNSYYKLDENILSIIPYKDIAKDIFE